MEKKRHGDTCLVFEEILDIQIRKHRLGYGRGPSSLSKTSCKRRWVGMCVEGGDVRGKPRCWY